MKKIILIALAVCFLSMVAVVCYAVQKDKDDTTISAQQSLSEESTSGEPTSEDPKGKTPKNNREYEDEFIKISVPENCHFRSSNDTTPDKVRSVFITVEVKEDYKSAYKEDMGQELNEDVISRGISLVDVEIIDDIDYFARNVSEDIKSAEKYANYKKKLFSTPNITPKLNKTKISGCDAWKLEVTTPSVVRVTSPPRIEYYIQADSDTMIVLEAFNYMTLYTSEIDSIFNSIVIK